MTTGCAYTAQGMFVCRRHDEDDAATVESFRQRRGTRMSRNDSNMAPYFARWPTASEDEPGHVFNACQSNACYFHGCEGTGRESACMVTCKCRSCIKNRTHNIHRRTLDRVVIMGSKSIDRLYWCPGEGKESGLKTTPCSRNDIVGPKIDCPQPTAPKKA